jgi:hypothetical protein
MDYLLVKSVNSKELKIAVVERLLNNLKKDLDISA